MYNSLGWEEGVHEWQGGEDCVMEWLLQRKGTENQCFYRLRRRAVG
jgi:hypothetical protein